MISIPIKDNGYKEKNMEKEPFGIKMEIFLKVAGTKVIDLDMEYSNLKIYEYKENGIKMSFKELLRLLIKMAIYTEDNI
jgi:hypothetical protein